MSELTTRHHDRDSAGKTYVYPVVSRRARGVSVGVNLNPNQACNWRCIYCQVDGLVRGRGPKIDLSLLETELRALLHEVLEGSFMTRRVPDPSMRRLNDVAFSGDGESTTSNDFAAAVNLVGSVLRDFDLIGKIRIVLITNGSMLDRPEVRAGIQTLADLGGEIWFKMDRGRDEDLLAVNDVPLKLSTHLERLKSVSRLLPCYIQTCMFARHGLPPSTEEVEAWLAVLEQLVAAGEPLQGVLLYGIARDSHQPEASELEQLPLAWLEDLAERVRSLGLDCQVSP